jgi:hypothetical protein
MKRICWALLATSVLSFNTGCCLLDCLIGFHPGYPLVPQGCGPMGGCGGDECGAPACSDCGNGPVGDAAAYGRPAHGSGYCRDCQAARSSHSIKGQSLAQNDAQEPSDDRVVQAGYYPPAPPKHLRGPAYYRNPRAAQRYQGPMTPQVVYPYYTTRGPRDFLAPNPPSIGP